MISKFIKLSVACFCFSTAILAQSLQSANVPYIGDVWAYKTITDTTIQPGLTGSGVTWNFTQYFVSPLVFNEQFQAVGTSGDDALFPTANLKVTSPFGGYEYYIHSSSGLQLMGYKSSFADIFISNIQNFLTVPLSYGQSITNQPVTGTSVSGFDLTGTVSAVADGVGTLQLSTGSTANALRVHYDANFVVGANAGVDTYVHFEKYCWYKTGLRAPVFQIEILNIDGILSSPSYQKAVLVNVVTPTEIQDVNAGLNFSLYPSPVKDKAKLTVNTDKILNGTYSIMDMTGRICKVESVAFSSSTAIDLDFADFPKGIYILTVDCGNIRKEQRFVVE